MTARESNSQLLCAQLQREKGSNHAWMCSACAWVFGVELKLVPLFFVSPNFFPRRQFFSPRKIGFTAMEICVFTDNSHVCFSMAWLCSTKLDCKGSIMNTVLGMKELKTSVRRVPQHSTGYTPGVESLRSQNVRKQFLCQTSQILQLSFATPHGTVDAGSHVI